MSVLLSDVKLLHTCGSDEEEEEEADDEGVVVVDLLSSFLTKYFGKVLFVFVYEEKILLSIFNFSIALSILTKY